MVSEMSNIRITFLGTGSGTCIHRAHTSIVFDCADGTRVLVDTGSGNALLRHGVEVGMLAEDFGPVLLTHHHADHMGGIPFLQVRRRQVNPAGPPLDIYSTDEALEWARRLCQVTSPSLVVDQDGARTQGGHQVLLWHPIREGEKVRLGVATHASSFAVDHISGSVGWRVESDEVAVVFSGDTRFSSNLVERAKGARLLIHEALSTEADKDQTYEGRHSTAADAGRAAALAGVGELVLTHIPTVFHRDPDPLVAEARRYFDGPISVARDLYQTAIR